MHHFVDNDVLKAVEGLLGEFEVEPNAFCFGATTAPLRFHFSDGEGLYCDTEVLFPLGY
jgi:hypothetical protein